MPAIERLLKAYLDLRESEDELYRCGAAGGPRPIQSGPVSQRRTPMPPETAPETPQELAQPLAEPLPPVQLDALKAVAAGLDRAATQMDAQDIVAAALAGPWAGEIAVVSSFGAEAAVLPHMVARARPAAPVLFIDTRLLFPETLAYQQQLATYLGLQDVRILRARHLDLAYKTALGSCTAAIQMPAAPCAKPHR